MGVSMARLLTWTLDVFIRGNLDLAKGKSFSIVNVYGVPLYVQQKFRQTTRYHKFSLDAKVSSLNNTFIHEDSALELAIEASIRMHKCDISQVNTQTN
jgi:hypothetical protein